MTSFTELGLAAPILKALEGEGYTTPTPIQAKAIPPVMAGRDLLGIAQTGTGKTAAFALPILHRLAADRRPAPRKGCRALVLSPTRELASQIADSFRAYGRHLGFSVATVFGGMAHRPQIQALSRGVDILIATPGRLIDHMDERYAVLEGTEIFVLDEADQMLDLGFVKPIRRIVSTLATRRQNLFFSATMPGEIAGLASEMLRDPERVSVAPVATTAERVTQHVIHIEAAKKRALLAELLTNPEMSRTLVFTRTKRGADRVARHLETGGTRVAAIHGNKSQRQREEALEAFRQSRISVLVATDIAARGIDIDLVTHVVNYELPEVPEAYVHRIGRTARAGASGIAISLCDNAERDLLRNIERLTRKQIPGEDRRGDAALVADRTPSPSRSETPDRGIRDGRGRGTTRPTHRGDNRRPHRGAGEARNDGKDRGTAAASPGHRGDDRRPHREGGAARGESRDRGHGTGRPEHRSDDRRPHRGQDEARGQTPERTHSGPSRLPHTNGAPAGDHRNGARPEREHNHRRNDDGHRHADRRDARPAAQDRRHGADDHGANRPRRSHDDRRNGHPAPATSISDVAFLSRTPRPEGADHGRNSDPRASRGDHGRHHEHRGDRGGDRPLRQQRPGAHRSGGNRNRNRDAG